MKILQAFLASVGIGALTFFCLCGAVETYNKIKVGAATRPFVQAVNVDPDIGTLDIQDFAPTPTKKRR